MTQLKHIVVMAALVLTMTGVASAIPATGTVLIGLGGLSADITNPITPASTFTVGSAVVAADGTQDFDCPGGIGAVCAGDPATAPASFSVATLVGTVWTFGPALRYSYTVDSVGAVTNPSMGGITFLNIPTTGTFVDSMGVFDTITTAAGFGITMAEACAGASCSLGGVGVFNATAIPEPVTMALFGSALVAIAGIRLRQSKSRR